MTKNIMIVGVGGQGTLLASKMLGYVLVKQGYDVKVSEEEIIKDMFEPGKKYVFDAELCRKDKYDVQDNGWINEIDGTEVRVITPILGLAKHYAIAPTWCREVE